MQGGACDGCFYFSKHKGAPAVRERVKRSLTQHFAQMMSLLANGSVWSWCFAVLEWVVGMCLQIYEQNQAEKQKTGKKRGSEMVMQ